MKAKQILEREVEGELLRKDTSSAGQIARDIIQGASAKLYKDGHQPTPDAIRQMADKMAANFHSQILAAVDGELQR